MWKWLTAAAVLVLATGLLPAGQALDVTARVGPVLVFLAAITIVAELADAAGLFTAAADRAARLARGSVPALFLLVAALATATT
ncbi:MAG: citrate transporter, partial [Geodermatophilaceae bacterium]|nr:citrate transporter [Geodermatophilaceae bacterium]